ncbi:MAG: glycosyltransferase [Acetatifactor sp.]|nr:glycosyltransferase [Acetatifactor sp.]
MRPILSISLLSGGRNKGELRKCLDSLGPIRDQLSSELIVVDTGCDEEARAIIEEYADQVVDFAWCGDFAKARNAGLKEAKGEWFLYIDDDEYFVNVSELVEFFQSGEYKQYGQACYYQRNYADHSGRRYQDAWASRMIKMSPEVHFVDRIHEYFTPINGANKLLPTVWVDHYGYVYDTPEEREQHKQRNMKLLEEELGENPDNLRIRAHLANEYRAAWNFEKLVEICEDSLKHLKKEKSSDYNSWIQCFYQGKLMALMCMDKFDEALDYFLEVIRDKRLDDLGRASLCSMGAGIYYQQQEYEKCIECCREYIRVHDKYGGELRKIPACPTFTQDVFNFSGRNNVYCIYMACLLKQGDTGALKEYFWKLGWEDSRFTIFENFLPDTMEALTGLPFEEEFVPIAQKLMDDELVRDLTLKALMKQIEEKGDGALYPLARIFAGVESEHYYIWYLKVYHAAGEGLQAQLTEAYYKLFQKLGDVLELEDRIFEMADEYGIALSEAIAGNPFDQWRNGVDAFCGIHKPEKIRARKAFLDRHCREGEIRYDYFLMKAAEAEAVHTEGLFGYQTIRQCMKEFSDRSVEFYRRFFRPEAFEGEQEMIPASCRLALRMQDVLEAEEAGDISKFREGVTGAMGVFGPMDDALHNFAKQYAEMRQEQLNAEDRSVSDEMQILARQVKQQVRKLVETGDKQTARGILEQLKSLVPNDPELAELEELCGE